MPEKISPYVSILNAGKVPKGAVCPFADKCPFAKECPVAKKKDTKKDFDCDHARWIEEFIVKKEYMRQQYKKLNYD